MVGCGGLVLLLIILAVGFGMWLTAGPGAHELNAYHPFRSPQAKERFLALYDEKAREWPVPSDTLTISTSYGQTFIRISGSDSAPPLVLMHGGGGNSLHWRPNISALSEHYQTFAVDNVYDFGRSVYIRPMKRTEDFVTWLDEVLEAIDLEYGVNMAGLSYGGWLTSQYALHQPERLGRVVLLAPAGTVLPLPGAGLRGQRSAPCRISPLRDGSCTGCSRTSQTKMTRADACWTKRSMVPISPSEASSSSSSHRRRC